MEKILKIEEVYGFTITDKKYNTGYDGFVVTTDKQEIKLGICNGQSCCENWGYFITNDEIEEFIGADVSDVVIVDACLSSEKAPKLYEGAATYINIETSKGTLQFTAYNEHNGYYLHEAVVVSRQLTDSEYL